MSQFSSRIQVTLAAGQTLVVDHEIRGVNDYASIVVIPLPDPGAWIGIEQNGDPTSAGVSFTNTNFGEVTFNVLFLYPQQIIGSQVSDSYVGSTVAPLMPADQFTNIPYRQFGDAGGRADWLSTSVNLAANPAVRNVQFLNVTAHIMTQTPENPANTAFTRMVQAIANLQALPNPMPAYPAFRIFPGTSQPFTDWFDITKWQQAATNLHNCALVRVPGDPRIGLDTESYSVVDSEEPSVASIAAYNAAHGTTFTPADLLAAMQPFIAQCIADGVAIIGMYPNTVGDPTNAVLTTLYLVQALGGDSTAVWWEHNTFESTELYRKNISINGFNRVAADQQAVQSEWNRTARDVYGITVIPQHIPASDEDEARSWGKIAEPGLSPPSINAPMVAIGELRWWFNPTRSLTTVGTPSWVTGEDLSPLNGADYVHYVRPLYGTSSGGTTARSCGIAASYIETENWTGNASLGAVSGSILNTNVSIVGLQIPPPTGVNTWIGMKLPNVLPPANTDPWTHKLLDITIPSTISADTPLWYIGQNNVEVATLWWIDATGEIVLYVKATGVNAYSLGSGLAKDTPHRPVIGRSGTTWRHSLNGGAAVDHTTPSQASLFRSIMYGMGCDKTTMANNSQLGGTGIIFTGQCYTYVTKGLLTQAQFQTLSYNGPYDGSHLFTTYNYPFLWFT